MSTALTDQLRRADDESAPAILVGDTVLRRAQLWAAVDAYRARLRDVGVGVGDAVAVQVPPSVTYLAVVLAVIQLDGCAVLLHHNVSDAERAAALATLAITAEVRGAQAGRITRFVCDVDVSITPVQARHCAGVGPSIVQFTSGSTGRPKAVLRTGESIRAELAALIDDRDWVRGGEVLLLLNSLVHSFGLFGGVLHALAVGAVLSFTPTALPRDLAATVAAHQPVLISGVPAHIELLTRLPRGGLASVRTCVSGGQQLPSAVREAFVARHDVPVGQAYGLTELGLVAADFRGDLAPAVGRVSRAQEVAIVADEVYVRAAASPYVVPETDRRWRDGWFATRDRGSLCDGVLSVRGRSDSIVAIGGLKVDLSEVEDCIADCAGVTGVVALFLDGAVHVFVESERVTAAAVHEYCQPRLSPHKRPRRVTVTKRLPRTASGKLVRDHGQLRPTEVAR